MIDNTLKAIETITGQLKSIDTIRKLLTMVIYMTYLIYRIIANNGYLALNIALLVLTVGYLSFYVCYISMKKGALKPKTVDIINRVYRWSKLLFSGIGVGLNLTAFLTVAGNTTSALNMIFAIILPVFFLLQLICDVLFEYANYCFGILKVAVKKDIDNLKTTYEKPIKAVKSIKETAEGFVNFKNGVKDFAKSIFGRKKPSEEDVAASDDNITGVGHPEITDGKS